MATTATKRKKAETNNPVGRPPKFSTLAELQRLIRDYFESCYEEVWYKVEDEGGNVTWKPRLDRNDMIVKQMTRPFTVSGLALALGTTRRTLLDYEQRDDEFSHTIKEAKQKCEIFAEESLFTSKQTAGVIFNMVNNYGWINKQEQQIEAKVSMSYEEQLEALGNE